MSVAPSPTQEPLTLASLAGVRVMDFTPRPDIRHPFDPDASGVAFGLDGVVYLIFEDPSDGYRSCAGPLMMFRGAAYQLGGFDPDYLREPVLCSHSTHGEYGGENDLLEVRSAATGKLIFVVGTENVDDYYPSYVCRWLPENLSANSETAGSDQ